MGSFSYQCVYWACNPAFAVSARAVVLHPSRAARQGAFIIAPTHSSPFDVPLVLRHTPRQIDFMSVIEMRNKPFVKWVFDRMNCFYLDRGRIDPRTILTAVRRLKEGRVVGMFPEGGIRDKGNSVLTGGPMRDGVAKLAQMAGVPIVPVVVLGGENYLKTLSWAPIRRTQYGVIYGEPLFPKAGESSVGYLMERLRERYLGLAEEMNSKL